MVCLGAVEASVGLAHTRFPNGGGWSYFICPECGRMAQRLRLFAGRFYCSRCLVRHGVRGRLEPMSVRQRAAVRAPELRALLESDKPLRLKPHLWGTMERRKRFEAALRQAEFRVAQLRVPCKKILAVIDPGEESDFVAPRFRPNVGRTHSPETRRIQSLKRRAAITRGVEAGRPRIRVRCIGTGQEFGSISEAANALGVRVSKISQCLIGSRKSTGGHTFEKV